MNVEKFKSVFLSLMFTICFYIMNTSFYMIFSSTFCTEGLETPSIYILLDFFFFFMITLIIDSFCKNIVTTQIIIFIFYYLFNFANYAKLAYSLTPIFIGDINFLKGGVGEIVSLIEFDTAIVILKKAFSECWYEILFLTLLEVLFIYLKRKKNKEVISFCLNKKFIIFPILGIVLVLVPSIFGIFVDYKDESFITSNQYAKNGLFPGIYGQELLSRIQEPKDYNEKEVLDILNNYESTRKTSSFGTPNVIVILGESCFDITKIKDLEFDIDFKENLNYLKENGTYFTPLSPSFGGRTALAEYEYTTLLSVRYLEDSIIPYNQFYTSNKNMENFPSITKIFNNNGYDTTIFAGYDDGYIYKTKIVYPLLGYDECLYRLGLINFLDDENKYKGSVRDYKFVSSDYLMECVKKKLESDNKQFIFVKTSQNHMPYFGGKYEEGEKDFHISSKSNKYNDIELGCFESYAQGLYDDLRALRNLYDYINTLDEPTLIVFFGDHLPGITMNNINYILESDLFEYDELTNYYNKYTTEGFILSNFDIDTSNLPHHLTMDMLSAYVLKNLDLDNGEYNGLINYLYDNIDIIPATNRFISIKEKEVLKTKDFLNDESTKEVYKTLQNIEYYFLNKYYKN